MIDKSVSSAPNLNKPWNGKCTKSMFGSHVELYKKVRGDIVKNGRLALPGRQKILSLTDFAGL